MKKYLKIYRKRNEIISVNVQIQSINSNIKNDELNITKLEYDDMIKSLYKNTINKYFNEHYIDSIYNKKKLSQIIKKNDIPLKLKIKIKKKIVSNEKSENVKVKVEKIIQMNKVSKKVIVFFLLKL